MLIYNIHVDLHVHTSINLFLILLNFGFARGASDWLFIVPWGLRRIINWIKQHYGNPPIYITENGVSDNSGTLDDQHRIDYLRCHINQVLKGSWSYNSYQY